METLFQQDLGELNVVSFSLLDLTDTDGPEEFRISSIVFMST